MEQEDSHSHDHSHGHDHDHEHNDHQPEAESAKKEVEVLAIETPNPNAYKFSVSQKVSEKSFSASNLKEAAGNPLAEELLSHQQVQSIFGVNDFITVTKKKEGIWSEIIPEIISIIQKTLNT